MTRVPHRSLIPLLPYPAFFVPDKPLAATLLLALTFTLSGCTTVAVVGATAGAAVGVTSAAVKTTGAAVGAVIPDGDDEDEDDD